MKVGYLYERDGGWRLPPHVDPFLHVSLTNDALRMWRFFRDSGWSMSASSVMLGVMHLNYASSACDLNKVVIGRAWKHGRACVPCHLVLFVPQVAYPLLEAASRTNARSRAFKPQRLERPHVCRKKMPNCW